MLGKTLVVNSVEQQHGKMEVSCFFCFVFETPLNTDRCFQFHMSNAVRTSAITLPFPTFVFGLFWFFFIPVVASDAMWFCFILGGIFIGCEKSLKFKVQD